MSFAILARRSPVLLFLLLVSATPMAAAVRGTTIRVAPIYLSPDATSAKLADVDRGREVIILDTSSNGNWAHVEANLTEERTVSGWMQNKGLILPQLQTEKRIFSAE